MTGRGLTARQVVWDGRPMVLPGGVFLPTSGAALFLELLERAARLDSIPAWRGLAADVRTACEEALRQAQLGHSDVRTTADPMDSSAWIGAAEISQILGLGERHCLRLIDQEAFGPARQRGRRKFARRDAVLTYLASA